MITLQRAIRLAAKWAEGYPTTVRDGEPKEYNKLCLMALRALQRAEGQGPLEYDTLLLMKGWPVWIEAKHFRGWDIVEVDQDSDDPHPYFRNKAGGLLQKNGYGKTWLAYPNPPAESWWQKWPDGKPGGKVRENG